MSAKVIINRWDGGQAEDARTTSINQSQKSQNFNIFSEPHRLSPYSDSVADTADVAIDTSRISDVGICAVSGVEYIVGIGFESAISNAVTFYTKTSVTAAFAKQASATGNTFVKGSGVTYKTQAYAVDDNGAGTYRLIRFNSAASVTTIGSISATTGRVVKSFVHPEDNVLYVVVDNVIARWDGSSFTTATTILPANYAATSLAAYGTYLAITMNATSGNRNPVCLLWGRDTTINTLQGSIDLGEGYVGIVANLNNNLIFVMSPYTSFSTNNQNKIIVKGWAGGAVETLTELNDNSTLSIGQVSTVKALKNNRVYFGFNNSDCIWNFGKNKNGQYVITQDRFITNGTQSSSYPMTQSLGGISIIGDVIWVGGFTQVGTYTLMRSKIVSGEGLTYASTSIYKTSINPSMPLDDRYNDKQLVSVQIAVSMVSGGVATLKYAIDGSSFTSLINETGSATEEKVYQATAESSDGNAPLSGKEIEFQFESTGGVKLKEIRYIYSNLNSVI